MATNQMRREAAKRKLERQVQRRAQQVKRRQRVAIITSVAVVVVVVIGIVVLTNLPAGTPTPPAAAAPTAAPKTPAAIPTAITPLAKRATALPPAVTCTYPAAGQAVKPVQPPTGTDISSVGTATMTLATSAGTIPLTLDRSDAPCTVNSIVSLAQQGYYNNTTCHRLTTDPGLQVLQCGSPTGSGGPGYTVPDEFFPEMTYGRGILAMANTGQPNSGGGEFFMIYGDGQLPPQYTVFGSVSPEGLQVIDTIARVGQDGSFDSQAGGGKPITAVTIQTATLS